MWFGGFIQGDCEPRDSHRTKVWNPLSIETCMVLSGQADFLGAHHLCLVPFRALSQFWHYVTYSSSLCTSEARCWWGWKETEKKRKTKELQSKKLTDKSRPGWLSHHKHTRMSFSSFPRPCMASVTFSQISHFVSKTIVIQRILWHQGRLNLMA